MTLIGGDTACLAICVIDRRCVLFISLRQCEVSPGIIFSPLAAAAAADGSQCDLCQRYMRGATGITTQSATFIGGVVVQSVV